MSVGASIAPEDVIKSRKPPIQAIAAQQWLVTIWEDQASSQVQVTLAKSCMLFLMSVSSSSAGAQRKWELFHLDRECECSTLSLLQHVAAKPLLSQPSQRHWCTI